MTTNHEVGGSTPSQSTIYNNESDKMKISVTGTDRGLGKSIADYCEKFYTVTRINRSDDLRDYSVRQKIIYQECDIFISVAKPGFSQTEFLYEWYEVHGIGKRVINIGSAVVYNELWGDDVHMWRYHTQKRSLAHAVAQINHPNITIIFIIKKIFC